MDKNKVLPTPADDGRTGEFTIAAIDGVNQKSQLKTQQPDTQVAHAGEEETQVGTSLSDVDSETNFFDPEQTQAPASSELQRDSKQKAFSLSKRSPKSKSLSSQQVKSLIGRTLGDYRFDAELGRGGMGIVYRARHEKLRRDVAIKMILGAASHDPATVERFEIEARAVAGLVHPNVVQLYEFGSLDGSPFFALEFIDSGTLAELIKEQPLEPLEAARIVERLAAAMQFAHDAGVLHRDLKPANVLMASDGTPKISDFGLAKELVEGDHEQTKTGTVMGTPSFMSPEQAMGQISLLTGSTDQYSLGAILYACISGRPPFMSASAIDTITQVVRKDPIPPRQLSPTIPADLETICLKTLQKDSEKRYANCGELAADLQRFLKGEPIAARPISKLERAWRWCKRNPRVAIPSSLAALFIIATAGISSWAWAATSAQAAVITQERDNVKSERDEAQRQRILATQQKAVAEDNERIAQKQAQLALQNIQFVITDVDKLLKSQPGMSEVRIGILEAVAKKWDDLNVDMAGGVRGEAIPTLMAVRHLIALAFRDLDRIDQASDEFSKLQDMARERIALKGRNDATRLNLAKILFTSALIARRSADGPAKGIEMLKETAALCREIISDPRPEKDSPSANDVLLVQAGAAQNLAVEELREGHIPQAEVGFSESLEIHTKVLDNIRGEEGFDALNDDQKDTKTAGLQIELDKVRLGLAYIRLRLGKTAEALPLYQAGIASRREIFDRRPKMLIMKSELAGFLRLYGKSLVWLNQLDEAAPVLMEALPLSEQCWEADPEKVDLKRGLADALFFLGTLRDLQGQSEESLSAFERCRLIKAELYAASDDERNGHELMLAEARVGNAARAKELSDKLGATDKTNGELHLERARALAQLAKNAPDTAGRAALESEALDALERSAKEGFSDPFRLEVEHELTSLRGSDRYKAVIQSLRNAP